MSGSHNNNQIEIELVDFFPVSTQTRVKEAAKKNIWPFVIGAVVAAAIAIGMVVGSGGMAIPGLAIHAAMSGTFAPLVTKIVIISCAAIGFMLSFMAAKFFGIGRPSNQITPDPSIRETIDNDDHTALSAPLRTSNTKNVLITHYHRNDDTVLISEDGNEQPEPCRKTQVFVPLKKPFMIKSQGNARSLEVTHYCEHAKLFRVYDKSLNTESDMPEAQVMKLQNRYEKSLSATKAPTRDFIGSSGSSGSFSGFQADSTFVRRIQPW